MKKSLKRILIVAAVLLLVCAGVVVAIMASGTSAQSSSKVKLTITGANLSFSDSVYIKYSVDYKNVAAEDVKMLVWTAPKTEYVKGTESAELSNSGLAEIVEGSGKYYLIYDFKGLAAKQMTDVIYVRAYAKVGDTEYYSEPFKYSILEYAYKKMGKISTPTNDESLIVLLEDMLNYGALAQKYTNYKTDNLATDEFVKIELQGGVFADGFDYGLYKVGTTVNVTAPGAAEDFDFVGWRNAAGEIVSTDSTASLTVGSSNESFVAIYQGSTSDKLEYIMNDDGKTYSVSGIGACTDENIVVPSVVGNSLITGICEGAFKDCTTIKSVTLSNNVTSIGAEAFSGCTALEKIYYDGIKSQWSAITKGQNWNSGATNLQIVWNSSDEDWELGGVPLN